MGLLRADRCSVCGRDVAGMEDARKEGKRWFCSPSCLMQATSGTWKRQKRSGPARVVRKIVISVVAVFVGLVVLGGVLVAVDKHNGKAGRLSSGSSTVPLHHRVGVGDGWSVKVVSARLHSLQVLGGSPKKTAAGGQDAMVSLSVRYAGQGYGHLRDVLSRLYVGGSNSTVNYQPDGGNLNCTTARGVRSPTPLNEKGGLIFPGHYARGHLCFLFPHHDAKTLALYVDGPGCNTAGPGSDNCENPVTFALR